LVTGFDQCGDQHTGIVIEVGEHCATVACGESHVLLKPQSLLDVHDNTGHLTGILESARRQQKEMAEYGQRMLDLIHENSQLKAKLKKLQDKR